MPGEGAPAWAGAPRSFLASWSPSAGPCHRHRGLPSPQDLPPLCALGSVWPQGPFSSGHACADPLGLQDPHPAPGLLGSCPPFPATTQSAVRACSPYHRVSGFRGGPPCSPAPALQASAPTRSPVLHPHHLPALTPGPRATSLLRLPGVCCINSQTTFRGRLSRLPIFVGVKSAPFPGTVLASVLRRPGRRVTPAP